MSLVGCRFLLSWIRLFVASSSSGLVSISSVGDRLSCSRIPAASTTASLGRNCFNGGYRDQRIADQADHIRSSVEPALIDQQHVDQINRVVLIEIDQEG